MAIIRVTNVPSTALSDDVITSAKIADGTIAVSDLANDSVTAEKIASNAVTSAKIADSNITTAKIADSNITTAKVADSNITTAKVADGAITTGHMHSSVPLGTKNLIINGDMRIAQRGTSAAGLSNEYIIDRWKCYTDASGNGTVSQDTDVPTGQGYYYSQKLQVTSTGSLTGTQQHLIEQLIEAQNLQHLNYGTSGAKKLTLSFWVKSNVTGTFIVLFFRPDDGRSISKAYTIDSADTWEQKSITIDGDTSGAVIPHDNGAGIHLRFMVACGSDFEGTSLNDSWATIGTAGRYHGQTNLYTSTSNYINITGVQLEVGDTATPFEHRPYDMELQRCMRYYERRTVGLLNNERLTTTGLANSSANAQFPFQHLVPKRATPSINVVNLNNTATYDGGGSGTPTSWNLDNTGIFITNIQVNGLSGTALGRAIHWTWKNVSPTPFVEINSEL